MRSKITANHGMFGAYPTWPDRASYASGNLTEAIRFDTSHAPVDSNGAFDAYDAALTKLTAINQRAFDQASKTVSTSSAGGRASGFSIWPGGGTPGLPCSV